MRTKHTFLRHSNTFIGLFVVVIFVCLGSVFYIRGQSVMQDELTSHLETLALTASLLVQPEEMREVHVSSDALKPVYEDVIQRLNVFRTLHPEIRFIYILRPTKNAKTFEFVVDADSLHPFPPYYDLNADGVIDASDELAPPGKPYDISEQPGILQGMRSVATSDVPYSDQWGTYMSGYAPIPGHGITEDTVIGVDMDIGKYKEISRSLVTPELLMLIVAIGIILSLIIVIELTKKKIESQKTVNENRTMLLHLTTHQLGAPIATLRWWLEILRDRQESSTQKKDPVIDELEIGMRRIENIIKLLEEAISVEEDSFSYNATSVIIETLIHEVIADMKKTYDRKHQMLSVHMKERLPEVRIDRRLIAGVIRELLENASSYSPQGKAIDLQVECDDRWLRITVSDRGIGIPFDEIGHITEKFKRASNAESIKPIGSGLGLHIAKTIIEKAGGTMTIESEEGKGTNITIALPIR